MQCLLDASYLHKDNVEWSDQPFDCVLSSKRVSVAKESPISFAYVIQVSERTANER